MYLESSWPSKRNDVARIQSRVLNASDRSCLVFYYFMYGRTMGSLNVFARDRVSGEETLIWSLKGNQVREWMEAKVPLNMVNSSPFQVITFSNILWSSCNFIKDILINHRYELSQIIGAADCNYIPLGTFLNAFRYVPTCL